MTTPTLPDTLKRLAELLPERVRLPEPVMATGQNLWELHLWHQWKRVALYEGEFTTHIGPALLEAAMREECEARGWGISQRIWNDGSGTTTVNLHAPGCPFLPHGKADTPAEALARAVLAAIEAQP